MITWAALLDFNRFFLFVFSFIFLLSNNSIAANISNLQELRDSISFDQIVLPSTTSRPIRIAILDKAFFNVEKEIGQTLPRSTKYFAGPIPTPADFKSNHGVRMAQIISGLLTDQLQRPDRVKLFLFNTFGFTNFRFAINQAIKSKVDIILYSEVWEFGGNLDGRGFINQQVSQATKSGILWINAAGNFAQTTYQSRLYSSQDGFLKLPNQQESLEIRCLNPQKKACQAKVVLSWNDFKEDFEEGTEQDLDLYLYDSNFLKKQSSELRQSILRTESRPGYSKYPREVIAAQIPYGRHFLKVKKFNNNFDAESTIRITVDGESIYMPNAQKQESILTPADHPDVLTVGALDFDRSGVSVQLNKPDVVVGSSVRLNNQFEFRGSSNSAALVAALAGRLKLAGFNLNKSNLIRRAMPYSWFETGLSLQNLGFLPTSKTESCFEEVYWMQAPDYIRLFQQKGARLVKTTQGLRMMTPYDPIYLLPPEYIRTNANDMILLLPNKKLIITNRWAQVPENSIEIFQRPVEASTCSKPQVHGRILGL